MAGRQRDYGGGIRSLLELIDQHREAIEYDLIGLGLRLSWVGTPALSWRDLWVIVNQAPLGSALDRAMRPDEALWGLTEQLLAANLDEVRVLVWQNTKDAQLGKNYPQPTPRPGVESDAKTHGTTAMSLDEMRERLKRNETA